MAWLMTEVVVTVKRRRSLLVLSALFAAAPAAWRGAAATPQRRPNGAPAAPPRPPPRPPARPPKPLVVLDPGHGGKDPGAIGVSGTFEKRIALAAALEVKRQLERGGRLRVLLTRGNDRFVPLEARVRFAQARGAALFVSIHADAAEGAGVRGASVYTLSAAPSDQLAYFIAKRENRADRFTGPAFRDVSPEVARILASLVARETASGSLKIARRLVSELDREPAVPLLHNPHRKAGFVVLQAPDVPSALVEMGFMSNRADEALLRRPEHRRRLAGAIARAVEAHFAGTAAAAPDLPARA